mgnify:CR=1 FL=1
MFRDKPTAYDRLTDAISDIGDRIAELEGQIADRVNPKPSTFERLKREDPRQLCGQPATAWKLPGVRQDAACPGIEDITRRPGAFKPPERGRHGGPYGIQRWLVTTGLTRGVMRRSVTRRFSRLGSCVTTFSCSSP